MISIKGLNNWGPSIVRSNLVVLLDAANDKSYSGTSSYWYDLSGNGNNAQIIGTASFSTTNKGSFYLNGTSSSPYQYMSIGNLGTFPDQGTIIFWFNPTVVESYRNPLQLWSVAGGNNSIRFEMNDSGGFAAVINYTYLSSDVHFYLNSGLTANKWYMVSLTWNKPLNRVSGTLNGEQKFTNESQTVWTATTIPNITIGGGYDTSRFLKGYLSSFMFYNRELSYSEVLTNYNAYKGRFGY